MADGTTRGAAAPVLAVVGGILAVAGSLLAWAEAGVGPASVSAKGIDGWEGKVTLVGGAILLIAGISAFLGSDTGERLRGSGLVGGLMAAGVGTYTALTARDQIVDAAVAELTSQFGVPEAEARSTIELALGQGGITIALQVGIWLVIAGGVLGVVAGIVAFAQRSPAPAMPAGGPGLRGWAAPQPGPPTPAAPAGWTPEPPPPPAPGSPSVWVTEGDTPPPPEP